MPKSKRNRLKPAAILVFFLMLVGCGMPMQPKGILLSEADPQEVKELTAAFEKRNGSLNSFKAVGQIKLKTGRKVLLTRAAWIGLEKNRLRLEILKPTGKPLMSLSSDGKWAYLLLRDEKQYEKQPLSGQGFGHWASVSVAPSDLVSLLCGRVPNRAWDLCYWETPEKGGGPVLHLAQYWKGFVEKLYFDTSLEKIRLIEMYRPDGTLVYRARWSNFRTVKNYRLPMHIEIDDVKGRHLTLSVDRIWPDAVVKAAQFIIKEPAK